MTKIKIFGVHLQKWHWYFIIPLFCLVLAGCAAGLLVVGTALSGSSGGGGTSSGSSVQRRVTGLVFSQGSENVIAPLGGATVSAQWGTTRSILGAFTKAVTLTATTTTNSDGSYELDGIDDNTDVLITIVKDGHTIQVHNVNTAGNSPSVKGTLTPKNQNKKTIFSATENDVNTDSDVSEKGEVIPRCHVVISPGAVAGDTEVELTPYYSLDNLPQPIPDGYIGLAGADFSAASTVTFTVNKEAKPYLVLPSIVRSSELLDVNIKLMELIETSGVKQWVVSKNSFGLDRECKYYSSGLYQGMLGPDDEDPEDDRAKLKGIRPFCFVYATNQLATIIGTVRNTTGTAIAGAMVFGGGSAATTDLAGDYVLERVIALSASADTLIMVNTIAPNYQLASTAAAVRANSVTSNVNITLETLYEVAILGGKVTDTATTLPIAGAKVVCTTNPYIAAFTYDNRGTTTDFSDDVLSVTPPANFRNYLWNLTPPSGTKYQSSSQNSNSVMLNTLFSESGFTAEGSYRVDLGITLTDNRTVTATAGMMSRLIDIGGGFFQRRITDIKLPVSLDPSITMEAYSNTLGNYRMIGVPTGVELKLQASKSGYQSSGIRTLAALTQGQTKGDDETNFILNAGSATVASIWITPSPIVSLQTGQTVQFSGIAKDEANNTISPTPTFTWTSSNPSLAGINSSGLASGQGSGSVTIEASTGAVTSNAVTVTVGGVPAAPSSFAAVATSSSQIDLTWQDNSANEDGFKIERSTNAITYTVISTQYPDAVAYNDTGLSANTPYYYRIYSYNANGASAKASASATTPSTPVPTGPSALIVTAIDPYTINLEWTDNSNNENGFQIRRSVSGDEGSYGVIDTVSANATTYQNTGLTAKSYNYYRVYAFNDSGNSTAYGSGWAQTPDTIPTAPSGLACSTTSSSQINLTWTDNSSNETWFKIERSLDNITFTQITTTTANAGSYQNTGLTYNTTYYYRVRAYNTAGNSSYSNIAYDTTNQVAPQAPTGVTIAVLSDTSIKIDWTDASDNEDSFKVQISTNGTTYTVKTTTAANAVVFTDTGLTALTLYYYRVYAYNSVGNSGYSNVVSNTTATPPIPADPTNLVTTTVTSSSIGLQWTDNSNNETGFKLDRSPDGVSNWVVVTTTAVDVIAFSDTALTPSTTFYYRVYAYNLGGDSNYASIQATTFATPDNLAFAVQPVNTAAGATIAAVQVQVRDASNNPLALDGVPITFTINKGALNGTLSKNTVAGIATFDDLSITLADTGYAIMASSGALTPATSDLFDITHATANNLTWGTSPAGSVAGDTMAAFTVRVRDIYANNVQGTTVSVTTTNSALAVYQGGSTVAYATAASGSDGLATFSTISMTAAGTGYVVRASSGALATADSAGFNITPGVVDNLAFVQQPTTTSAGAIMSPPVTVRVKDVYNNVISGQSVSVTTTDGTLINGTVTQNSNASGIATFSSLSMTSIANDYVLSATSGAISTTSSAFDITAGVANLSFIQQPANTVAGATMASITVKAQNAAYVPIPGVSVSITTTNGVLINGTLTQDTDVDGIATFTPLSITLAANDYVLSASAGGYSTIVSTVFNITPASANNLTFSTQPAASTAAGATMAAVRVTVRDQYSNLVPSAAVSLTTTTQLNGTTTVNSDAGGVAAFNDLYITTTATYQLSARAGAVGPTNSDNFDITSGAVVTVTTSGPNPITSGIESASYTAVSKDAYNNNVADTYTWAKANGTGTATLSVDKLTGVLSGTVTITATSVAAPAKSGGKTVTVNPGAANSLTFVQQPTTATVSVAISPAITVRVQDVNGNLLSGVSVSTTTTNGTALSGTFNQSSNTSGIAAFNDLSIASSGSYALSASATGAATINSNTFNIMPTLPIAPSGLTATAISPTAITITWTDNSSNETGFKIERFISGSYQEIDTVSANVGAYTNNGLSGNTLYYYKVRAYNVTGNSDYTNVASVTTPIAPPAAPSGLITTSVTASVISLSWNDNSTNEDSFKLERSINGTTYTLRTTLAPGVVTFDDTGLTENTPYWYRVYAVNGGGNSAYSNVKSATTLLPVPADPSVLSATAVSSSQINLTWQDNSSNETGFKMERSPNGTSGWSVILTPTANSAAISNSGLTAATTYYYRILAYNATGNSGYSSNVSATTLEVPPVTPTNLTISATAYNSVALTWTDTSSNEAGFKLERKVGAGSYGQVATPTANAISYTDNTVASNTLYYYRIRAYNTAGNSAYSNEASTTTLQPPAPNAPTGLITTTVTSSSIGLQWTDNSSTEDGFKIERKITSGSFAYLDLVAANINAYTNTGLTSGITYTYRVYAYNGGGPSTYTNIATATTLIVPPTAPSGLITTTVTSSSIGLQWQDNSNDETAFKIERSTNGLTFGYLAEVGTNVISFTNSGLPASTTYWYRVYASNTAGPSGFTNVISTTTLAPPPPTAPTNLVATAQTINKIHLTWDDNSSDEAGFKIERSLDSISFTQIATVITNTTYYDDMAVSPSITYWYRVKAYNSNGDSTPAGATGIISVQPDGMIRLGSEADTSYVTDNSYESTPVSQTKGQNVESNRNVSYYIRVQNDGNLSESFKVTGAGSSGNWTVTYYDETSTNITYQMTGISGYLTSSLAVGSYIFIRMEVGQSYAQTGAYYDTVVRVTSTSDPTRQDVVKARTEAIPTYYSISGNVYYGGFMTGQIYLSLDWFSSNGEPGNGTSIPWWAGGAFTIRGVQSGEYNINAYMDHLASGVRNAGNPSGSSGYVNVTSSDVYGVSIYIYDPIPAPTPSTPGYVQVSPADSSGLAFYDTPKDFNGNEIADFYCVYWDTNPTVSKYSYLGYKYIPANSDNAAFITGLSNGSPYFFVITALVNSIESAESFPAFGPVVIGPTAGNYNVSGTVFYPDVTPTGPLYVGVYNDAGAITYTLINSPAYGAQTYSFAGVANGTYTLWASLDMNNNGLIDAGDCKDMEGAIVTVNNADVTNQDKTLPTGDGTTKIETSHYKYGTDDTYRVNLRALNGRKQVVSLAAISGPGITSPIDIDKRDREFRYELQRGSNRPITSDNYAFYVTYSDYTAETLNGTINEVLDSFALALSPTGTGGHVAPTFAWSAPAAPPSSYSYYMWVDRQSGGNIWRYPSKSGMPSSQLSVLYNVDSGASQSNLDIGTNYNWYVMVRDSNGNSASQEVSYSPTYFDRQPDAMIKNSAENDTAYLTDNIYEVYPAYQIKYQDAFKDQVVSYVIKVQNEGASAEPLIITGTAGNSNWIVKYFDGIANITGSVTGVGYTTASIAPAGYKIIRLEINPTASATVGSLFDISVTAKSYNDQSKIDVVKARTGRVNSYAGLGNDGPLTVTGLFYIDAQTNAYNGRTASDGWSSRISGLTSNSATLVSTPAAGTFNPNDEVLIISVKGSPISNVGNYEFLRVASVSSNTVYFTNNKLKYYGSATGSDNNVGSSQFVILQRVPNYSSVLVNWNAELTCQAWNGTTGGVLAFRCNGTVSVGTSGKSDFTTRYAYIRAEGKGQGGGAGSNYSINSMAGETYFGTPYNSGGYAISTIGQNGQATPNPGGGGGGGGDSSVNSAVYTGTAGTVGPAGGGGGAAWTNFAAFYAKGGGGGGGGYCATGSNGQGYITGTLPAGVTGGGGGNTRAAGSNSDGGAGGGGGSYNSSSQIVNKAYFGAGGGAGGGVYSNSSSSYNGGNGGSGGGFVFIGAVNIYVYYNVFSTYFDYGYITVNGANGVNPGWTGYSLPGGGGGGAGGSMVLRASYIYNQSVISAYGGSGGYGGTGYAGGSGGSGGVYYQYNSLSGAAPVPSPYNGGAPSE